MLTKKEYIELVKIFKNMVKPMTLKRQKEIYRETELREKATVKQWYKAMKEAGIE
jgi:hypothetical protein